MGESVSGEKGKTDVQLAGLMGKLFREKILLYKDLLACLDAEKKCITDIDVDALWASSGKKHELASRIEALRKGILESLAVHDIDHDMKVSDFSASKVFALLPVSVSRELKNTHAALITVKREVELAAKGNKAYVEDYLSVMDDMIGTITRTVSSGDVYSRSRQAASSERTNLLLHKEV